MGHRKSRLALVTPSSAIRRGHSYANSMGAEPHWQARRSAQAVIFRCFFRNNVEPWPRLSPEQIYQVIVEEAARRVHFATDCLEVMKARIEQRHVFRPIEMQLPPMRSRTVLPKDRVDVEEIAPIVDARSARDGDRDAGALIIRAQHARVAS